MAVRDVSANSLADLISLKGRNAVVTGAAWGLGRATAFRLAEAGASVLIGDIDIEKAAATAAEIAEATGARVLSTHSDAGDSASVIGLVDEAVRCARRDRHLGEQCRPSFVRAAVRALRRRV